MAVVSIFILVSNGGKYLERCLKSLRKQTFKDTDIFIALSDSLSITETKVLSTDNGIKIFRGKTDAVIGSALAATVSPYVMFCGDGDWYEPLAVERMLKAIKEHDADLAICDVNDIYADDYVKSLAENVHSRPVKEFINGGYADDGFIGNKIFKKSLLDKIDLSNKNDPRSEKSFIGQSCSQAENYYFVNERLYSIGFRNPQRLGMMSRFFGIKYKNTKNRKPFVGIYKSENSKTFYFFRIPLIRIIKDEKKTKVYFLGICLFYKKYNFQMKMSLSENYMLSVNYQKAEGRRFLLFDCLYDKYAEAIDAYSLYSWMRQKGIDAAYVLRKDNKLASAVKKRQICADG